MFAVWWFGISGNTLAASAQLLFAATGQHDITVFITYQFSALLPLTAGAFPIIGAVLHINETEWWQILSRVVGSETERPRPTRTRTRLGSRGRVHSGSVRPHVFTLASDANDMDAFWRAFARVAPVVTLGIILVLGASARLAFAVGFPVLISVSPVVRVAGLVVMASGVAILGWLLYYRSFRDIVISTDATMLRALARRASARPAGGPLVVSGPHRIVRHPMYTAIIVAVLGLGVATGVVWIMIASLGFLAWYRLVVIPFEDRDLAAKYGDAYLEYKRNTPALIPIPMSWRSWKP